MVLSLFQSRDCTAATKPKSCYKCGQEGHIVRYSLLSPWTPFLISDASGHSYSLATAPPPPLAAAAAVVVVAGAAARVVPSATAVVRLGTSRATAQMRPPAAADADTVVVVVAVVAMAASAAEAKRATPVGVLDTFLGTVFKGASAITAAGR